MLFVGNEYLHSMLFRYLQFDVVALFAIRCCNMQYILDATFEMQCLQCNTYDSMLILYLLYNVDSSLVMDSFRNDNG